MNKVLKIFPTVLLVAGWFWASGFCEAQGVKGKDWIEMDETEKTACVVTLVERAKQAGVSMPKTYYEYTGMTQRYLIHHPELIEENFEAIFSAALKD